MNGIFNMTNEELIELGRRAFDCIHNDTWAYNRCFGKPPYYHLMPEDYGERYKIFFEGWREEHDKWYKKRREELKVNEFESEFKELCEKYNVEFFSDEPCFKIDNLWF